METLNLSQPGDTSAETPQSTLTLLQASVPDSPLGDFLWLAYMPTVVDQNPGLIAIWGPSSDIIEAQLRSPLSKTPEGRDLLEQLLRDANTIGLDPREFRMGQIPDMDSPEQEAQVNPSQKAWRFLHWFASRQQRNQGQASSI